MKFIKEEYLTETADIGWMLSHVSASPFTSSKFNQGKDIFSNVLRKASQYFPQCVIKFYHYAAFKN